MLRKTIILMLSLALCAAPAFGQYLGQVQIQTVQAQLALNTTCTGNPQTFLTSGGIPNFINIGQTFHQASATSAASTFTIEIDGIDVANNIVRISNPTISYQPSTSITGYVAQGSGYYPNIQVTVTCTAAATFSLTYSGSTGGGTPIIATPGTVPTVTTGGVAGNVQGILPPGLNGISVNPLILGALQPAINGQVATMGIDTFSSTSGPFINTGMTGNLFVANPPQPSPSSGAFAVAFYGPVISIGGSSIVAPWVCQSGGSCSATTTFNVATLANYTTKNTLAEAVTNGGGLAFGTQMISFAKTATLAGIQVRSANNATLTVTTGDTLLVGFSCLGAVQVCGVTAVTDTQGNKYFQLGGVALGFNLGSGNNNPITIYAAKATASGANTVTVTETVGGPSIGFLDMSNITPAPLNAPNGPLFESNRIFQANEDDNGTLFAGPGAFDLTQTVTLGAAGTTTFPMWAQTQHGIFYSCTVSLRVTAASGTTPTLDTFLQDSGDNVGFNDRMHFPQATTTGNFLGAVSGGVGGITPVATTDGSLAASTKVDGPLSAFGRMKFIVGGTTPSFSIVYNVACR